MTLEGRITGLYTAGRESFIEFWPSYPDEMKDRPVKLPCPPEWTGYHKLGDKIRVTVEYC